MNMNTYKVRDLANKPSIIALLIFGFLSASFPAILIAIFIWNNQ